MRTEAKIGILVGIIIALGVIVYTFAFSGDKPAKDPAKPAEVGKTDAKPADSHKGGIIAFGAKKDSPKPGEKPDAKVETATPSPSVLSGITERPPTIESKVVAPSPGPEAAKVGVEAARMPSAPAASPAPGAGVKTDPTTYTVQDGDTLWTIAARQYKDGSKYPLIVQANPGCDKGPLRAGRKLTLPAAEEKAATAKTIAGTPASAPARDTAVVSKDGETYVVQENDGFWSIASKVYHDGGKFYLIQQANPGVTTLRVGQKIVIPKLPDTAAKTSGTPVKTTAAKGVSGSPTAKAPAIVAPKHTGPSDDGKPRFYDM